MKRKKIILFSLTALLICLVTVMSCVFINSKDKNLSNTNTNENLIVQTNNSDKIKLVRKKAVNDSGSEGSESVFIAAELNGSNTDYIQLSFDLAWSKNTELGLYDCLRLDVSEDNRSCLITYLNPFDVQVILTVTAVNDDTIKAASCTIDCYTRVTDINDFALEFNEERFIHYQFVNGLYIYDFLDTDSDFILNSSLTGSPVDYECIGSVYKEPIFVKTIHISEELLELFAQNDITPSMTNSFFEDFGGFSLVQIMSCLLNNTPQLSFTNIQMSILKQCTNWFYVTIEVDGISRRIELVNMPVNDLFYEITLSLSKDSVIF